MNRLTIAFLFLAFSRMASAQSTHDVLVASSIDLLKTDNNKIFGKVQLGAEANYFIVRHFAVGGGLEVWTGRTTSFVMGMRWYANDNFFVRMRSLVGINDVSAGVGYSKPIGHDWRVEGMADLYARGDLAFRAGVAYVIH